VQFYEFCELLVSRDGAPLLGWWWRDERG
jgi:hypothetical protein